MTISSYRPKIKTLYPFLNIAKSQLALRIECKRVIRAPFEEAASPFVGSPAERFGDS